ncbi:uncharacterized protein Z518_05245 [Rhinocladiella mackenziei CBS 650.93]|uniref:Rhinocladiella mackenziei CBS 650.93 unplaced genomic scaffold supercont1.4, whole genome shotgun sequence n=1 Tax=Rhinocladiella mackenziei CBS 650.93 TaxID=1442369 RepID=A0A0D2FQA3_9EURO|nr:uncharacterized protein Z518_05245 [Rhinocladiella mackenziei CBS 650.93]KIX04377.1 hypothetical protein Z518_05245 [Rhinocladiella mackenziei CBS 650.93]
MAPNSPISLGNRLETTSTETRDANQKPPTEERALAQAVKLSLEDQAKKQANSPGAMRRFPLSRHEAAVDLVLSLNNEFTNLDDPDGDTVIYIGPPPRMPEQTEKEYSYISNHFDQVHIVKSTTLKLMGDTSRFSDKDLLGPKSVRAERKLRKLGVLSKAEARKGGKFKYYIDLRPPKEDEEAVILITDLTCTKGVLAWHLAKDKYDLSPMAVSGHDEFGVQSPLLPSSTNATSSEPKTSDKTNSDTSKEASADNSPKQGSQDPPPKVAPEYSPLRHTSAIERLVHAIHGNNPKLDSAPKVWTYFAVARYFGCAHNERISGWITTWIYTQNNVNFIQNNPEVAYRIGMGIRSPDLVQDAFSILVGERALLEAYGEFNAQIFSPLVKTVHGRKLELLDDDERNRIDHAASSFVRRIRGLVVWLCRDMGWLRQSKEYAKLDQLVGNTAEEVEMLESTKKLIKDYVRSRIYYVLCQDQYSFDEIEASPASTLAFRSATDENYVTVYNGLNQPMRVFTKSFWLALQRTQFDTGLTNTGNEGTTGRSNETRYVQGLRSLYADDPLNGIISISRVTFDHQVNNVNRLLHLRETMNREAKGKGKVLSYLSHEPENILDGPENIPLGSLAIGSPRSGSDRNEPSFPDGSRAKYRKILESDDISHAVSSSVDADISAPGRNNSATKPSTHGLAPVDKFSHTRACDLPVLPLRPKQSESFNREKDYLDNQFSHSKAEEQEVLLPPRKTLWAMAGRETIIEQSLRIPKDGKSEPSSYSHQPSFSNKYSNQWWSNWDEWDSPVASEQRNKSTTLSPKPLNFNKPTNKSPNAVLTGSDFVEHGWEKIHSATMLYEIGKQISNICSGILYPPHLFHQTGLLPTDLFDNLLCLDANEFQYLPLWVPNGNDDGSGGVFDECPVPNLDPTSSKYEPFPAGQIRVGYDKADSDFDGSIEDVASQAISTVGKASKLATDGTETIKSLSSISVGEFAATETALVNDSRSVASVVVASVISDEEMVLDADADLDHANGLDDDDDDTDTLSDDVNGEMSASLQAFLHSSEDTESYAEYLAANASTSSLESGLALRSSDNSMGKGKGKEIRDGPQGTKTPVKDDDDDDDFEFI